MSQARAKEPGRINGYVRRLSVSERKPSNLRVSSRGQAAPERRCQHEKRHLQETEPAVPSPTCSPTFPPTFPPTEQPPPALLETIARRLLDELGGGQLVIMKRGAQTIQERAAELVEEEQRSQKRRW